MIEGSSLNSTARSEDAGTCSTELALQLFGLVDIELDMELTQGKLPELAKSFSQG